MKKAIVLSIAMLCLLAAGANAQTSQIGVFTGVNFANIDFEIPELDIEFDNRTTFEIGFLYEAGLSENMGLCFQPMYIQKGAEEDLFGFASIAIKGTYIEVPVFLKFYFSSQAIRPYIMAGPYVGYNLSAEIEISAGGETETENIKDDIKDFDMGIGGGLGFSIKMDKITLFAEIKYMMGLIDVLDTEEETGELDGEEIDLTGELKTKGIQIMAGITFPLGQ